MPDRSIYWYIMGVNGWYIMAVNSWYILGVKPWYIIACKVTNQESEMEIFPVQFVDISGIVPPADTELENIVKRG